MDINWEEVKNIAYTKVKNYSDEYTKRLDFEFKEIIKQGANDYWLDIINNEKKYDHNKNGLVLPFLLGLTDIDPIKGEKKLLINGDDFKINGIEIILDNGTTICCSEDTLVKTTNGFIKAKDLSEGDEV
jgi:hypothetical protein